MAAFARLKARSWPRLSALGKLSNTTAFKLTLVYLTVFALFAAFLLGYFAWNTRRLITEQITRTVDAEITGLAEQYSSGRHPAAGLHHRCARAPAGVEPLSRRPRSAATGLPAMSACSARACSNIPAGPKPSIAGSTIRKAPSITRWCACSQLPSGFRLLVGRDLEERERLYDVILAAGQWSIALVIMLGLAGGFFVARRVLRRVDAMTETTRTIMAGDLSAGCRSPVPATSSTGWRSISTSCWSGSRR